MVAMQTATDFDAIAESQYNFIKHRFGEESAQSANYGCGTSESGMATKIYNQGILTSYHDENGNIVHELKEFKQKLSQTEIYNRTRRSLEELFEYEKETLLLGAMRAKDATLERIEDSYVRNNQILQQYLSDQHLSDERLRQYLSDAAASGPEEDRSLCHSLGAPKVQTVASLNQGGAGLVCAHATLERDEQDMREQYLPDGKESRSAVKKATALLNWTLAERKPGVDLLAEIKAHRETLQSGIREQKAILDNINKEIERFLARCDEAKRSGSAG
jgi:hypothetical protein